MNIASNHFTHEPVHRIERRVRGKGTIEVAKPNIIRLYNKGMGGVDLMDRLLGSHRPTIRAKKWWWPLMTNLLNISIVAGWKFYCIQHQKDAKITHLEFRRNISLVLTKSSTIRNQSQGADMQICLLKCDMMAKIIIQYLALKADVWCVKRTPGQSAVNAI